MLQAVTPAQEVIRKGPSLDSQGIGKAELAERLGWSRPKLDRRLESDQRFPVMYRGGQGKGRAWQFDLEAVRAYLEGDTESGEDQDAIEESSAQTPLSDRKKDSSSDLDVTRIAEHSGEATARSRRDSAQASLLEDKLRKDRGQLLEVEDVRDTLSSVLVHLSKGLDTLPDAVVARCALVPAHGLTIREIVNNLRTEMVNELQKLLRSDVS